MIFLVLTGAYHGENLEHVRRYREHIDGIDLRADYLADPWAPGLEAFLKEAALSAILTIRKPEDGGRWKLDEGTREALFRDMLNAAPFAFVDLEGSAVLPGFTLAGHYKYLAVVSARGNGDAGGALVPHTAGTGTGGAGIGDHLAASAAGRAGPHGDHETPAGTHLPGALARRTGCWFRAVLAAGPLAGAAQFRAQEVK